MSPDPSTGAENLEEESDEMMNNDDKSMSEKTELSPTEKVQIQGNAATNKKGSLLVIYLTMMITMMSIAIGISSTWPYLRKIDKGVSPTFLGWANFGFNLGAIFADLVYGRWMSFRPNREPLLGSMFVMIVSGLIYAFAEGIGGMNGRWAVLVSRVFLGMARGNMTITRAVVSESTTPEKRSHAMANLVIAMTAGFASGSGIQALMALIGDKGFYISALKMHINLYTIPAYLIVLIGLVNSALVIRYVKPIAKKEDKNETVSVQDDFRKGKLMACVCLVGMFAIINFSISVMETLMVPFVQHQFALTNAKAVWYGGLVFACQGVIAVFQQGAVKLLLKRFSDRVLALIAYAMVMTTFFLYIPMGSKRLKIADSKQTNLTQNSTGAQGIVVGCPAKYDWCRESPQIWLPQFLLGAIFFAIGYSSCLGLLISLYTKILSAKRQGTSVSIISAFGNIGRLTAPIAGAESYVGIGPQYTYMWICLMVLVGLFCYVILFRKMVPQGTNALSHLIADMPEGDSDSEQKIGYDRILYVTPM